MNRTIDKFVLVVTVMLTVLALAIVVTHRQKPVAVPKEVQYRYLGDKSRPDTWLRKYSVPAAYYVWDDEFGRYVEVSKEKFDATPLEEPK